MVMYNFKEQDALGMGTNADTGCCPFMQKKKVKNAAVFSYLNENLTY